MLIKCWDDEDVHVKLLRQGLPSRGGDVAGVRLPLVFEHYEEDIYMAHRELLRSYPRSFWEMRERACEEFGELSSNCSGICFHQAYATQWAYLIGLGSLRDFPPYLVSPGVRLYNNYATGKTLPEDKQNWWMKELMGSAETCIASKKDTDGNPSHSQAPQEQHLPDAA